MNAKHTFLVLLFSLAVVSSGCQRGPTPEEAYLTALQTQGLEKEHAQFHMDVWQATIDQFRNGEATKATMDKTKEVAKEHNDRYIRAMHAVDEAYSNLIN